MLKTSHEWPVALENITGLSADSRTVKDGFLFAALSGKKSEGSHFIDQALSNGAKAVLVPKNIRFAFPNDIIMMSSHQPRRDLAHLAAAFFQYQPDNVVAVTGTNGKSSVVDFLRQIWEKSGYAAASLGTVGLVANIDGLPDMPPLTTADPVSLHDCLAQLEKKGISHMAIEASSHGLDQYRVDGIHFKAAAFTNLSRDHLDYHKSYQNYFTAKARLFNELLEEKALAVIKADPQGYSDTLMSMAKQKKLHCLSYALEKHADFSAHILKTDQKGSVELLINWQGKEFRTKTDLLGRFQIENLLCAAALSIGLGEKAADVFDIFSTIKPVRGRLEPVSNHPKEAIIFIDYAHTPDALRTALITLRPYCKGRLFCLFGCGGNRDQGKRKQMGSVAADYSDIVIISDDNPRDEQPEKIRADIIENCKDAIEIGGRKKAIFQAITMLEKGDILLIAGKGHETGQIIGKEIIPFDDYDMTQSAIKDLYQEQK